MPVEGRSGLNRAEAKAATVGGRLFFILVHCPMRIAHKFWICERQKARESLVDLGGP